MIDIGWLEVVPFGELDRGIDSAMGGVADG